MEPECKFLTLLLICFTFSYATADFNVTCDLDLPGEITNGQLPKECEQLTEEQRNLAIEEAKAFKDWYAKLNEYEERHDPGFVDIPQKQWVLREKIAMEGLKYDCRGKEIEEYYKCLKERRDKMIEIIPTD